MAFNKDSRLKYLQVLICIKKSLIKDTFKKKNLTYTINEKFNVLENKGRKK